MDPLVVDVWSDIACPWCFIGKRRLEKALADEAPGSLIVRWRAFQLAPDMPVQGVDAAAHYARKFGPQFPRMHARVVALAAEDGLAFQPLRTIGNTRLAHRLVAIAQARGFGDAVVEGLFSAYHEHQVFIGDLDPVLAFLAGRGVDVEVLRAGIAAGEGDDVVDEDLQAAAEIGIGGVPFFVGAGKVAVSGAQEPETFRAFLAKAREMRAA